MEHKRYETRIDLKKYDLYEIVLHHLFSLCFIFTMISGFALYLGSGGWVESVHLFSGYVFILLFVCHLVLLIMKGMAEDIPVASFPFMVKLEELKAYFKGDYSWEEKFSFPERLDYLAMLLLATLLIITGFLLKVPSLIPFGKNIASVYSVLSVHFFASVAFSFWILGYHIYFSLVSPLPGNSPSSMMGKPISLETIRIDRPHWFEQLIQKGVIEIVHEEEDIEEVRRETVLNLLSEANRFVEAHEYDRAESLFTEAIRLYPSYSQAHFNLAILYVKKGNKEKAISQFKRFIEIDPFSSMAAKAKELIKELDTK